MGLGWNDKAPDPKTIGERIDHLIYERNKSIGQAVDDILYHPGPTARWVAFGAGGAAGLYAARLLGKALRKKLG